VHEFVKTSLRVHRNEKGWRALGWEPLVCGCH